MVKARKAINRHGETDEAMRVIEESLQKLAENPDLKEFAKLEGLHGGTAMTAQPLASEGDNGITLFIVRITANNATRIHDYTLWGVIHVLDGRDKYIQWTKVDDHRARWKSEVTLEVGQSIYWLPPPYDLHSQESLAANVWEIIISGKILMSHNVTDRRRYYEPIGVKEK